MAQLYLSLLKFWGFEMSFSQHKSHAFSTFMSFRKKKRKTRIRKFSITFSLFNVRVYEKRATLKDDEKFFHAALCR